MAVYIYINGIMCRPGNSRGWTDKATTWTIRNTSNCAEKFEYFSDIIRRSIWQNWWASELAFLISGYRDRDVILVGHSNGCDLIVRALHKLKGSGQNIKAIHMFSPACEASLQVNGLNWFLANGRVEEVTTYIAGWDRAMWWAWFSRVLRPISMGYGLMGLHGPTDISPEAFNKVRIVREEAFGHSDWFADWSFVKTMELITEVEQ